jgi:hypothetical protein
MALDQVGKETGRQHGIADARRGDKQDVHLASLGALYPGAYWLAKQLLLDHFYCI